MVPWEGPWLRADLDDDHEPIVTMEMHNDMPHQVMNFPGWGRLARCHDTGTYFRIRDPFQWVMLSGSHFRFRTPEYFGGITPSGASRSRSWTQSQLPSATTLRSGS